MATDYWMLCHQFLSPQVPLPPARTVAEIDAEEERAIAEYQAKYPAPKHDLTKLED
jgi:hypothetical protein